MNRTRPSRWLPSLGCLLLGGLLSLCAGSPGSARAEEALNLSLVPSATEVSGCSETDLSVSLRLSNPAGLDVGGYQVFLRYAARAFAPVRFEAVAVVGLVDVAGPAPVGEGFASCSAEVSDGWADLAGEDVIGVVATVFGAGSTEPLRGTDVELGRFIFRPRETTSEEGALFSSNVETCRPGFDAQCRVFDPSGVALALTPPEPVRVRVTDGGLQVSVFTCTDDGDRVSLAWTPPPVGTYSGYRIYRNGLSFATFPIRSIVSYADSNPPDGKILYRIVLLFPGGVEGCSKSCEVDRDAAVLFIRGDANDDGKVNISDPIAVLDHLFQGRPLSCEDAGDFDDSGTLNITDAVVILTYLFDSGEKPTPPPPFPLPGPDPTPDSLGCRRA